MPKPLIDVFVDDEDAAFIREEAAIVDIRVRLEYPRRWRGDDNSLIPVTDSDLRSANDFDGTASSGD
jgi:hypothetical protein